MRNWLFQAAVAAVFILGAGGARAAAPAGPTLAFPLACTIGRGCEVQNYVDRDPAKTWADYHCGRRSYDGHTGTDIRVLDLKAQRAGVEVRAAAAGRVLRRRDGVPDVLLRSMSQPHDENIGCGNAVVLDHGDGWITAYCHMARGSVRVKVGQSVAAGAPLGLVGLSGNTQFPHLHIEVRHNGQVVDPFAPAPVAPGACAAQPGMWNAVAARQLSYKRGAILNAGLAGGPVTAETVEDGGLPRPDASSPVITAYMRGVALETGDVIEVTFTSPGRTPTVAKVAPLTNNAAQPFIGFSRKRPAAGWPSGRYVAQFRVLRAGSPVLTRTVEANL